MIEDTRNSTFDMVLVKGGVFTMGCRGGIDIDCEDEEKPSHEEEVNDFYICKYEVTQAQWKSVMGTNPSFFTDCDSCPVESVSYDEIQTFIDRLNEKFPSLEFRLPVEKEWEFAARGGRMSKSFKYCGSDNPDEVSWFDKNGSNKTHPVGQKKPNELGLYDMGGNVWEFCSDWFYFYTGPNSERERGPLGKVSHSDRGGCWQYSSRYVRPGTRGGLMSVEKNNDLGFRLARPAK
jgi:formylglycine-generating enzyme required for sulfatase activity